ncbi:MAG TPA: AAA family ATPase [Solirubrobacteraceae bacterium]|nr:AAA family ATPase [Solirubrobacteraceae bacterium]
MRDRRRFGPGPYLTGLRKDPARWGQGFPYDVPAVAAIEDLDLDTPITLLAGDNGTGKSTIVEAIAEAMGFAVEGGELERLGELPAVTRPAYPRGRGRGAVRDPTHSPILLATPGARIYELDDCGVAPCAYDDLDTVRLMRGFLEAPERYLRAALGE